MMGLPLSAGGHAFGELHRSTAAVGSPARAGPAAIAITKKPAIT